MSTRFVSVDRNQPLLLPPDLREWVPEDDLVHFVIEAVEGLDLASFKVNVKGPGSAQYPPHMMLSLLIYCYANGVFASRRIERAAYRDVRYDRAGELVEQLELEVHELMDQAERTDQRDEVDGQSLPEEIARRERLKAKLEQAYNARAAVDANGSQLVLSTHVSQCASDKNELVPAIQGIPERIGQPDTVLADNGYLNEEHVRILEGGDDERYVKALRKSVSPVYAKLCGNACG